MDFFAFNIHLGYNMWFDKNALLKFAEEDNRERDFLYFDKTTWDTVTEFLPGQGFNTVVIDLAEGVRYDSAPELAVEGSLSKEELSQMLSRLRSLGLNPIPKLDFSSAHDIWMKDYARMLCTTPYRNLVKNLIAEVSELFDKPAYFHIGMGDENNEYQKYYEYIATRSRILFWEDTNIMLDACRAAGARPMMSGEYFYQEPYVFNKEISSDVVITAPYIGDILPEMDVYGRDTRSEMQKKFEALCATGLDVVYHGNGSTQYNLDRLFNYAKDHNCFGVMTEPGVPCVGWADYYMMNDAYRFGWAKKEHYTAK